MLFKLKRQRLNLFATRFLLRTYQAGIYSAERSASVGCPAAHGARAVLGLAGWSDEPQLFLDDQPEVIAPEPPTWREFLKTLDAKD